MAASQAEIPSGQCAIGHARRLARRAATASAEEIARSNASLQTGASPPTQLDPAASVAAPFNMRHTRTPASADHGFLASRHATCKWACACRMLHVPKEGAYQRVERLVIVGTSCRPEVPAHDREQLSRSERAQARSLQVAVDCPPRLPVRQHMARRVWQPTTDYSGEGSRSRSSRPPRCWSLRRRPALCEPPQDRVALSSCAKKKAICRSPFARVLRNLVTGRSSSRESSREQRGL